MDKELEILRKQIDDADKKLIEAYEERLDAVYKIAYLKADSGIEIEDKKREKEILERVRNMAKPEYRRAVKALYEEILKISKENQKRVIDFVNKEDIE